MNLTTLRLEVRERVGELTADFFTDAQVDRAINEAIRRFSQAERWPWLITDGDDALADDEDEVELPVNVSPNRVLNVAIEADGWERPKLLERVAPHEGFRLKMHGSLLTPIYGPRYYYILRASSSAGDTTYTLRFVPIADQDYTVTYQYYAVPEELTSASETPDVPVEYQDAIPSWAAGKLFLTELDISEKASEQFGMYAEILAQARAEVYEQSEDATFAMGREHPGETGWLGEYEYVMGRIAGPLG